MKTLDQIIADLNAALALDPGAVNTIVSTRTTCSEHFGFQTPYYVEPTNGDYYNTGGWGMLNGILEDIYGDHVAGIWEGGTLRKFIRFSQLPDTGQYQKLKKEHDDRPVLIRCPEGWSDEEFREHVGVYPSAFRELDWKTTTKIFILSLTSLFINAS